MKINSLKALPLFYLQDKIEEKKERKKERKKRKKDRCPYN